LYFIAYIFIFLLNFDHFLNLCHIFNIKKKSTITKNILVILIIGSCFAGSSGCGQPGQDAVVVVNKPEGICQQGTFNDIGMHYPSKALGNFFSFLPLNYP